MFEQEIELEKKQSAAVPLLLIVGLIVVFVAVAGYFLAQSRQVLPAAEARTVVTNILQSQGAATVKFETGMVEEGYGESTSDARYRLLEKIGVVKIGKTRKYRTPVSLTPAGAELLKQIPSVTQSTDANGNAAYVVPLATRKLLDVSKITMSGPERATIQYSWRWEPNVLGENFDAAGARLHSFSTSDQVQLIDKFGARFYHDAPATVAVTVVKGTQGWQIASE
ncbi:MAG TPA: hypothetical protein VLW06_05045 [Terriglobales bacterium]|nr:hypothetical protein [Terriglobales bacterium]